MRRARESAFARKVTKYAIGSVIALVTSIVVFALLYVDSRGHDLVLDRRLPGRSDSQLGPQPSLGLAAAGPGRLHARDRRVRAGLVLALIVSSAATGFTNHEVNVLHVPAAHRACASPS